MVKIIRDGYEKIVWQISVSELESAGQTDWKNWEWTAPSDGQYTLEIGVKNIGESGSDSSLLIDDIKVE